MIDSNAMLMLNESVRSQYEATWLQIYMKSFSYTNVIEKRLKKNLAKNYLAVYCDCVHCLEEM